MKGILIPIGGAESKGAQIDLETSVLSEVVRQSLLGTESNIIIIPTASSLQEEVSCEYRSTFEVIGCKNISTIFVSSKDGADTPENLMLLEEAHLIMFSGGDQSKIIDSFLGTRFLSMLRKKYRSERFVVAGTSAGAMCMSGEMIAGGHIDTNALFKGSVRFGKGLGLLPEMIIDTHFIKRGRFGRLTEAVSLYPGCLGIGLAEDTGIIIKDGKFRVIGTGMVVVFDPSKLKSKEDNSSLKNLKVHILSAGDGFSMKKRKPKLNI